MANILQNFSTEKCEICAYQVPTKLLQLRCSQKNIFYRIEYLCCRQDELTISTPEFLVENICNERFDNLLTYLTGVGTAYAMISDLQQ